MKKYIFAILLSFLLVLVPIALASNNSNETQNSLYRSDIKQRMQDAKENYEYIKQQYQETKQDYLEAKEDFLLLKAQYKNLTNQSSTDIFERYQNFLTKAVEKLQHRFEILLKWVDTIKLDEDLKQKLEEAINEDITKLEEINKKIQEATTISELREAAVELKELKNNSQHKIRNMIGHVLGNRFNNMIDRLEDISEGFHKNIDSLDSSDEKVAEMQELLKQFDEKLDLAKSEYQAAKDLFQPSSKLNESQNSWEQIREHLKKAKEYLKEAHKKLKELAKLYKEYIGKPVLSTSDIIDDDSDESEDSEDNDDSDEDDDEGNQTSGGSPLMIKEEDDE